MSEVMELAAVIKQEFDEDNSVCNFGNTPSIFEIVECPVTKQEPVEEDDHWPIMFNTIDSLEDAQRSGGSTGFVCSECGKSYINERSLRDHMTLHSPVKPFVCSYCGKRFHRSQYLRIHTRIHTGEKPYKCQYCGRRFTNRSGMNYHVRTHTGYRPYQCDKCEKKYTCQRYLRQHILTKHTIVKECNKQFVTQQNSKIHAKVHVKSRHHFNSGKKLLTHQRLKSDILRARQMHKGLEEKISEDTQVVQNSSADAKSYLCILCNQSFLLLEELQRHITIHNGFENVLLSHSSNSDVSQDNQTRTSTVQNELASDTASDTRFRKSGGIHVTPNWMKSMCKYCGKYFKAVSNLNNHIRIHTGEKPYSCRFCGRRFAQAGSMRSHELTHTGEKKFTCGTCRSSFARAHTLERHFKARHGGRKSFMCQQCEKKFSVRAAFYQHLKTHDRVKDSPLAQSSNDGSPRTSTVEDNADVSVSKDDQKETLLMTESVLGPNSGILQIYKSLNDQCGNLLESQSIPTHHDHLENIQQFQEISLSNLSNSAVLQGSQTQSIRDKTTPTQFQSLLMTGSFPGANSGSLRFDEKNQNLNAHHFEDTSPLSSYDSDDLLGGQILCGGNTISDTRFGGNSVPPDLEKLMCNFCGKYFKSTSDLNIHIRIHTGERPYSCKICGWRFAQSGAMTSHMLTHTGEKKHTCGNCGRSFARADTLSRHFKARHGGRKSFMCQQCGKKFSVRSELLQHRKTHEGVKDSILAQNSNHDDLWTVMNVNNSDLFVSKVFQNESLLMTEIFPESKNGSLQIVQKSQNVKHCNILESQNIPTYHDHTESHNVQHFEDTSLLNSSDSNLLQNSPPQCVDNKTSTSRFKSNAGCPVTADSEKLMCNFCGKYFKSISNLKLHKRIHTGEKPHSCKVCGWRFVQAGAMRSHELTHIGEKKHTCGDCGRSFARADTLSRHFKARHGGRKSFMCQQCRKKFSLRKVFIQHLKTHNEVQHSSLPQNYEHGNSSCMVVDKADLFVTEAAENDSLLTTESSRASNNGSLQIDQKSQKVEHGDSLKSESIPNAQGDSEGHKLHLEDGSLPNSPDSNVLRGSQTQCIGSKTSTTRFMSKRRNRVTLKFMCKFCGKYFKAMCDLNIHIRVHTGEKPYSCKVCGWRFARLGSMRCHVLTHTGEKKHTCGECGRSFARSDTLKRHLKARHGGRKSFMCKQCRKKFSIRTAFLQHLKTHREVQNSSLAQNSEHDRGSLQIDQKSQNVEHGDSLESESIPNDQGDSESHKFQHLEDESLPNSPDSNVLLGSQTQCVGNKASTTRFTSKRRTRATLKFMCKFCRKYFKAMCDLNIHIRVHTGEKPYSCKVCGWRFARLGSMRCHVLTHTGEKKHTCGECGRSFARSDTLKRHLKARHGGRKSFMCQQCRKMFWVRTAFLQHLKLHERVKHGINAHNSNHGSSRIIANVDNVDLSISEDVQNESLLMSGNVTRTQTDEKIRNDQTDTVLKLQSVQTDENHLKSCNIGSISQFCNAEKNYLCDQCGETFSDLELLTTHVQEGVRTDEKHSKICSVDSNSQFCNAEKKYLCDHCGYNFSDLELFKTHQTTHGQENGLVKQCVPPPNANIYLCDECGDSFSELSALKFHLENHADESSKRYQCSKCGVQFKASASLSAHIRTHIGPKFCEFCGRFFARPGALKEHMRTNTRKCGMNFAVFSGLTQRKNLVPTFAHTH